MNALFMRRFLVQASYGLVTIATAVVMMACHSASPVPDHHPLQESLKKKSKEEILMCAGPPVREWTDGDVTMLRYYREAPILEESMVSSKASRPTAHHGCWATLTIRQEQIERVYYRFVPPSVDASNDCEEIFVRCQE